MNTSTILGLMKARIEALAPREKASDDDVFRIVIGFDTTQQGSRIGLLAGSVGNKATGKTNRCNTWQTSIEFTMFYPVVPAAEGEDTTQQRALTDAEDILADLYIWASTTDGIHTFSPSLGRVDDTGQGELQVSWQAEITFERS